MPAFRRAGICDRLAWLGQPLWQMLCLAKMFDRSGVRLGQTAGLPIARDSGLACRGRSRRGAGGIPLRTCYEIRFARLDERFGVHALACFWLWQPKGWTPNAFSKRALRFAQLVGHAKGVRVCQPRASESASAALGTGVETARALKGREGRRRLGPRIARNADRLERGHLADFARSAPKPIRCRFSSRPGVKSPRARLCPSHRESPLRHRLRPEACACRRNPRPFRARGDLLMPIPGRRSRTRWPWADSPSRFQRARHGKVLPKCPNSGVAPEAPLTSRPEACATSE
jgi:hypothetical protein